MLDKKRVAWFILLRMVVVSVFLVSTIIFNLKAEEAVGEEALTAIIRLILATYSFSLLSLLVLKFWEKQIQTLTYAQIVWDLSLVTMLVLVTGGVNSPYAFLYFLSIISASILHARSQTYYTASLCVILYGAILDLQYYGKLDLLGLSQMTARQYGAGYLCYLIFLYSAAFYLTAFLAGHLAERAQRSESALQEKAINFQELERLHSSIVSTIESGLLTITSTARIRVFNRYLEGVTGLSQREAYDRPLVEVIPGFAPYVNRLFGVMQGELDHTGLEDEPMVLAFKSVPLTGEDGELIGAVIDLHDLTQMKRLAGELKKADRLAAVGELSARMAHEIRNPLAAISGSVQLVALSTWANEKDKRLLSIILRETDRLDCLLSDFLLYARPAQPEKVPLHLRQVIADLSDLLSTDPRMQRIKIDNQVPESLVIHFDRDQCEQVFLNLIVNGAESIEGKGAVSIEAILRKGGGPSAEFPDQVLITIADDGAGMTQSEVKRVFEPFFSTKKGGTGLGLATVYRIVETHGGQISVQSEEGAGTSICITLPA